MGFSALVLILELRDEADCGEGVHAQVAQRERLALLRQLFRILRHVPCTCLRCISTRHRTHHDTTHTTCTTRTTRHKTRKIHGNSTEHGEQGLLHDDGIVQLIVELVHDGGVLVVQRLPLQLLRACRVDTRTTRPTTRHIHGTHGTRDAHKQAMSVWNANNVGRAGQARAREGNP
jgi:hypothetical protein